MILSGNFVTNLLYRFILIVGTGLKGKRGFMIEKYRKVLLIKVSVSNLLYSLVAFSKYFFVILGSY